MRLLRDLFKRMFRKRKNENEYSKETYQPKISKAFHPERKKPPSRWVISHNMVQAKNANELRRRRKRNKIARKSRKVNYKQST